MRSRTTEKPRTGSLPARLRAVAAQVPDGVSVADIGSGDGLLAAHLARAAPGRTVIATENKRGPFEVVLRTVEGLDVDVRYGEGLATLRPGEAEVLVIAGMGGHRIAALLAAEPGVVAGLSRLVLQPMQHLKSLVDELDSNGFQIERLVAVSQSGRTHTVLVVVPPYSRADAAD